MKIPKEDLIFSVLTSDDNVTGFPCCEKDRNDFLIEDALTSQNNRISVTHLVYWNHSLVGFYTLISDNIEVRGIQKGDGVEGYTYSQYPALKIARLATDNRFTERDSGRHMLRKILVTAIRHSHHVVCRIITVDVKPRSVGFYKKIRVQHDYTQTIRFNSCVSGFSPGFDRITLGFFGY